jgi:hypothetical protein
MLAPFGGMPSEPVQHRVPGGATANERPSKREKPAGEPAIGADKTSRSSTRWEASDQRRAQTSLLERHSESGVLCIWGSFSAHPPSSPGRPRSLPGLLLKAVPPETPACQRWTFPVLSELPIKRLTQATQYGLEHARRRASTSSSGSLIPIMLCVVKAHIGKGILREKQGLRRENSGGRMELIDDSRG